MPMKTSTLINIAKWLYASTMLVIVVIILITTFGLLARDYVNSIIAWGLAILALITGLLASGIVPLV